jgi:hypothetical protein
MDGQITQEKYQDIKTVGMNGTLKISVAEPPKLYGPHAPIIDVMTSNDYACAPDNLKGPIGCSRETRIIHDSQLIQDQQRSCYNITTFVTKICYIGVQNNITLDYKNM